MRYQCLGNEIFSNREYSLRSIKAEDMEFIRVWRNAQMSLLRQQKSLSFEDQEKYWNDTIVPLFEMQEPPQVLFSFIKNNIFIGYGGLTYLDWNKKSAEVSFLLDPEFTLNKDDYQHHFSQFLNLLKKIAFKDLALHRLYTETFNIRPDHIQALEICGFVLEERLKERVKIGGRLVDSLIHECTNEET